MINKDDDKLKSFLKGNCPQVPDRGNNEYEKIQLAIKEQKRFNFSYTFFRVSSALAFAIILVVFLFVLQRDNPENNKLTVNKEKLNEFLMETLIDFDNNARADGGYNTGFDDGVEFIFEGS